MMPTLFQVVWSHDERTQRSKRATSALAGQSLVEFLLVTIVMIPILMAAIFAGMAMYQASMASNAIKEPTTQKNKLADASGAISPGQLLSIAQGGVQGKNMGGGGVLDSVKIAPVDNDTSVLVGQKQGIAIPIVGTQFTFSVSQPIQAHLLAANNAPFSAVTFSSTCGGKSHQPPWTTAPYSSWGLPPLLQCGSYTVTELTANALYPPGPPNLYIPRSTIPHVSTHFTQDAIMAIANSSAAKANCDPGQFAGQCQTEMQNLMPGPLPGPGLTDFVTLPGGFKYPQKNDKTFFVNPPGAPGQQLEEQYNTEGQPTQKTFTPYPPAQPPNGMYFDPTSMYVQPPAGFVQSCQQRKAAECQVEAAANMANQLSGEYCQECP